MLAIFLLSVACGSGESGSPATSDATAASETAAGDPATAGAAGPQASTAPVPSTAAAPDPDKVATFRRSLLLGRRLSRAGQHAEAIAAFQIALEAMPGHPVAQGELGFAALGAGDLPLAERASRDSARGAIDPKQRAASLYNLGQALERQGKRDEAARAYVESLALRPHPSVEARLASLGLPPAPAGTAAPAVVASAGASLADACRALEAQFRSEAGEGAGVPRCDPATARVVDGSGALPSVAVLSLLVVDPRTNGEDGFMHLAIRTATEWSLVGKVGEWISPGALGMSGACETRELTVRDLVTGGDPEVVADVECTQNDVDFGICEESVLTVREVTIAGLAAGRPRVVRVIPVARSFERRAVAGCEAPPELRTPGLPVQQGWRGAVSFEPGSFSLSLLSGDAPADVRPLFGTKSIE